MAKIKIILFFWIITLGLLYSTLSILRHNHFQSGGFDLGLYDQAVWQYSRLLSPFNTIKERHILGDHLTLTLPLLAPLFWLWNDVRLLLIFQAFWISFSSLAIYKLARLRKFSAITSFNLAFIYSLFYGIQQAIFFDFHPVVIGVGLIAWLIYFLEAKKKKLFLLTLILVLLTQENMGIALACLGLIYFFKKEYRKLAIGFILGGLFYSLLATKIIAHFSNVGFQYWPKISFNLLEFFNSTEKRLVWLYSLSWFSFLPMLSLGAMLAVFLDLAQYFLTGPEFSRMWSPFMHHRGILAPFLILGTLEILRRFKKQQTISMMMLIISLGLQYFFHFPLNKLSKKIYWQEESWMKDNRQLLSLVPAQTSIATQQNLIPHLSHRKEIYLVWPRIHGENEWWLEFNNQAEYLVLDSRPNQWLTQILESNENWQAAIKNMENAGKIILEKSVGSTRLYRVNRDLIK